MAVKALELRCKSFGSIVPAECHSWSSSATDEGVGCCPRRGVVGMVGRTSSIFTGESDKGKNRFRSLQAAMMDNGDAHRLERHVGAKAWVFVELGQVRFFKYDLPKLARGEMLVEPLEEADDTFDLGDHPSESLTESSEEGGVSDASYVGIRLCDSKGFIGNEEFAHCR
jgi:hypothetical protein